MAKEIYRVGANIFDAQTGIKIANPETLRAEYSGAKEVKAPIRRDGAGFGVGTSGTPATGVDSWKNYQTLKEAAQKILEMKTNKNADLTASGDYWRGIQKDITPFGGARDASSPAGASTFNDKDFQLMSPADQASIRLSREGAAQAHLQGISQEMKYRESIGGTALQNVGEIYRDQQQSIRDAASADNKNIQTKTELGIPLTDEDYKGLGVDAQNGKTGGTVSWRNNNPGNIKWGSFAESMGATKGAAAKDGGFWAVFPTEEAGTEARKALLLSPRYAKLDLDKAFKVWSGGVSTTPTAQDKTGFMVEGLGKRYLNDKGYNYQGLVRLGAPALSKPLASFTPEEWAQLEAAQRKAEGWKEGTILQGTKANNYTDTQLNSLAKETGKTLAELKAMTTDALNALSNELANDPFIKKANESGGLDIQTKYGISAKDIADILRLKSLGGTAINDYRNELIKNGVDTAALDETVKLNEPKASTSGLPWEPVKK